MKSILCLVLVALAGSAFAAISLAQFKNDNNVLNYALTLENFESTLYALNSKYYNQTAYTNAGFPAGSYDAINFIGGQEAAHVQLLTGVLGTRGWPAVPVCSNYNFTGLTNNVTAFVATLAAVEAVGTGAYDGAALALTDKGLLTTAAGIATVEARHTAVLNFIINAGAGASFTPNLVGNDMTNATTFSQTIAAVLPFLSTANCSINTTTTSYAGTVSVGSLNTTSYQWVSANSLRNQSSDLPTFYKQNSQAASTDIGVLQYALALENLEATFYAQFAFAYSAANITAAYPNVTSATANIISANFAAVAAHEASHVAFLQSTIQALSPNTTAGFACPAYGFAAVNLTANATFDQFLAVAAQLENTGVAAYVGAIANIIDSDVATVAASIATVEGNHAAYITNLLANIGTSPALDNEPKPSYYNPAVSAGVSPTIVDNGLSASMVLSLPTVQALVPVTVCGQSLGSNPGPYAGGATNFFGDANNGNAVPSATTGNPTTATGNPTTTGNPTSGTATSGTATSGTATTGTATSGTATTGTATTGTATTGTATTGTTTAGTSTTGGSRNNAITTSVSFGVVALALFAM